MKTDYNSIVNQEIKGKFVGREVYCCFSYEMDAILKKPYSDATVDLPKYDDIENPFYFDTENVHFKIMSEFPFNEKNMLEYSNDPDTFNRRAKTEGDYQVFLNSLDDEELEELADHFNIDIDEERSTAHEIFEWWIVSEFLYRKLKEKGYPVLEWGNNYYWGRCTTGQAILLDYVISSICEEMEILDGQKYSWSK